MSAAAPKKSYLELAKEAIAALKERTGSSPKAIKAYITSNHPSIKFAQHLLRTALNKGVETGKFIKVKASFKLAASEKKTPKKVLAAPTVVKKATPAAPKKAKAAPAAAPKKKAPVKKAAPAKTVKAVKSTPVKTSPKPKAKAAPVKKAAPKAAAKKVGASPKKKSPAQKAASKKQVRIK